MKLGCRDIALKTCKLGWLGHGNRDMLASK